MAPKRIQAGRKAERERQRERKFMKNKLTVKSNKYMLYAEEMRWSPIRVTETAHTINVNSSTSEVPGHMVGPAV